MELLSLLGSLLVTCGVAILFLRACWLLWRTAVEAALRERISMLVGVLGLAAVSLIPASIGDYRGALPMALFVTASWVVWAARGVAVAAFGGLAIGSLIHGRRRGLQGGLLAILVFIPAAECGRFVRDPAPWQPYGTLDHPSGVLYAYVESSFMQGQLLAIARVEREHWYGTDFTALVLTNGDSPRAYVSLVRPDALDSDGYGRLYLAPDGRVIGVRSRNHAYMALDPSTGEEWSHQTIYRLSPFILLDAQARPSERDTALIMDELCTNHPYDDEYNGLSLQVLRAAALEHENAAVRTVAQQLLTKRQEPPCVATAPVVDQN